MGGYVTRAQSPELQGWACGGRGPDGIPGTMPGATGAVGGYFGANLEKSNYNK